MGCTSCKKKAKEIKFVEPLKIDELVNVPVLYSEEEMKQAYYELTSYGGVKEDKKQFIQDVYQSIFSEPFDFNCGSCVSRQVRKFQHYLTEHFKIKL